MKHLFYIALVVLTFSSCQQQKIGFVDNGTVINDFEEKKAVEEKYQALREVFGKRTDSISQAFQLEAQSTQSEAQKLVQRNRKKAEELMMGLQQKQQQLQSQMEFENQQMAQAFQAEIDSVIIKVKDFVKDYGKNNGYTYILGTSDAAATVMYGADENDLTQIITEALNASYEKKE